MGLRVAVVLLMVGYILACPPIEAQDPGPGPGPGPIAPDRDLPPLSGFPGIPFNFGPPGARSLGMGGTFIAIADDATAAEANPAGLTNLTRPEVSVHGRSSSLDGEVLDLNAVVNLDTLNRFRQFSPRLEPDTRIGNAFANDNKARIDHSVDEASFASFVKPMGESTYSIYLQRSADFESTNTFIAFDDSLLDRYQARQRIDLSLENIGVSAAFKATPNVSVGFSLRYSLLQLDALQETRLDYLSDLELEQLSPGASLEEVQALGIIDQRITAEIFDHEAHDITFNVGLLFNPAGKWSVGLVYKDGGEYEIDGKEEQTDCLIAMPMPGASCEPQTVNAATTRIKVPDFLGLGFAWRPTDRFKAALDLNHITYSDLALAPASNPDVTQAVRDQFENVDDALEVHLGLEYIFLVGSKRQPLTVRTGAYTDPDHDGFREIDTDETVITAGIGTVLMESFQLDLAAQWGDAVDAGILSLVYRF